MILQKSLKEQYNGKWILFLILANKLKSYYLAKKQGSNLNHHWIPVHQVQFQKRLSLFLDLKLSFDEHIQWFFIKRRKIIELIKKLQPVIPRADWLTIYQFFLSPDFDYGDAIYDRAFTESFQNI